MEFKSLRNIESSFRQIRLFGIVFLSLCAVITVWSVWSPTASRNGSVRRSMCWTTARA